MDLSAELAAAVGVISSVFSAGIAWGITRTQIEGLKEAMEEEVARRERLESRMVTMDHFKAVVEPIQQDIRDLGRDIKKILAIVSRGESK